MNRKANDLSMAIGLPAIKVHAAIVDQVRPEVGVIVISEFMEWLERRGARIEWDANTESYSELARTFTTGWSTGGSPPA